MPLRLVQIDAFTDRPFAGNPAAVCVLPEGVEGDGWLADEAMQAIAREMNLSETAFLRRKGEGRGTTGAQAGERIDEGPGAGSEWDLRWFTPGAEVELCGHATLASAHQLWEAGLVEEGAEIRFHTLSGVLTASRSTAGDGAAWIELDFPAQEPEEAPPPAGLLEALGVDAEWVGTNGTDWLVEVCGEAAVRAAEPDLSALKRLPARGVILTAASAEPDDSTPRPAADRAYDFVSRFFAPAVGVPEDPVTGSAHCCLAPYWAAKLGRDALVGYQASARGGFVRVRLAGHRVLLGGQAVTVLTADLVVAPAA